MKPRHAAMALAFLAAASVLAGCGGSGPAFPTPPDGPAPPAGHGSGPAWKSVTCHGDSSDAVRLQQAIDASPRGSTVFIGGPVCLLTAGITMLPGRTYTGTSMTGTVLRQDAPMPAVLASSAYVRNSPTTGDPLTVRNLTVACNGSGQSDGIIMLDWLADVDHVEVTGCPGSGIVDTSLTASGRPISNTSVNSRFEDNFISNSGRYGFYVDDPGNAVTDGYLVDNEIASSGADAIHLQDASGWTIRGNHLYQVGGNAIFASRLYGSTISDNYIEDFGGRSGGGTAFGIEATAQGGVGSTITGNKVFDVHPTGADRIYIGIIQVNAGTSYLTTTGNVIHGSGSGIGFLYSAGAHRLIVASSGNSVSGVASTVRTSGNVSAGRGS